MKVAAACVREHRERDGQMDPLGEVSGWPRAPEVDGVAVRHLPPPPPPPRTPLAPPPPPATISALTLALGMFSTRNPTLLGPGVDEGGFHLPGLVRQSMSAGRASGKQRSANL